MPRARRRYRGWYRLISPVAVVVLWQLASSAGLIPEDKLPPPTTVWHTAVSLVTTTSPAYGTLPDAMLVSGCTPGGARAPPVSGLPDPGVIPGLLQRAVVSMTGN